MLASSYPLLDIFWTMLWFFCFILWIWLLIYVFADIFRSHDMNGGVKALWVIFIVFIPLLGVLVYVIARGHKMAEHTAQAAAAEKKATDEYIRATAGTGSDAEELSKVSALHDQGAITDDEFAQAKAKILG